MRIVDVRATVVPIQSAIRNAYVDFSQMTVSVIALVTDVVRDGRPVVGFGFNSNGRYAPAGLLRERFLPRLEAAPPEAILDDSGRNLDPFRIWRVLMANEKPGGHGERSVAVGVIDMAVWDAVAKVASVPLYRLLADRFGRAESDRHVWVYAAGGYYYPGKDVAALRSEMQSYLDRGYSFIKMKIGGCRSTKTCGGSTPCSSSSSRLAAWRSMRTAASIVPPRSSTAAPWSPVASSGTRSRATRSITRCTPKWQAPTTGCWLPERICFRCRTRAI
jgi:L-alanine-DL-glutamate epimerase-like enolase superfamily enzyme